MTTRILAFFLVLSLSGCMTCREHPMACSIVGAVVVGSIAATIAAHDSDRGHARAIPKQQCVGTTLGQILCAAETH